MTFSSSSSSSSSLHSNNNNNNTSKTPQSPQELFLSDQEQNTLLSLYPSETQKIILSTPDLKDALTKRACGATYFFTLRYGNFGGVFVKPRRRQFPLIQFPKSQYQPVDVLDLSCYLFGEDSDMRQFRRVVRHLKDSKLLLSRGSRMYANEILNSYFGAGVVYMVWRFWMLFYIMFALLGVMALPGRLYAGALNGLFLIDGIFDVLGSSNLRSLVKFFIWLSWWILDRILTPYFTDLTPLMSMGLLFLRLVMIIVALRCASNKDLSDHEYIEIQNEREWKGKME